jgi:hypothetical protein
MERQTGEQLAFLMEKSKDPWKEMLTDGPLEPPWDSQLDAPWDWRQERQ